MWGLKITRWTEWPQRQLFVCRIDFMCDIMSMMCLQLVALLNNQITHFFKKYHFWYFLFHSSTLSKPGVPTLPTMLLNCLQLGCRFRYAMLVAANVSSSRHSLRQRWGACYTGVVNSLLSPYLNNLSINQFIRLFTSPYRVLYNFFHICSGIHGKFKIWYDKQTHWLTVGAMYLVL